MNLHEIRPPETPETPETEAQARRHNIDDWINTYFRPPQTFFAPNIVQGAFRDDQIARDDLRRVADEMWRAPEWVYQPQQMQRPRDPMHMNAMGQTFALVANTEGGRTEEALLYYGRLRDQWPNGRNWRPRYVGPGAHPDPLANMYALAVRFEVSDHDLAAQERNRPAPFVRFDDTVR